MNTNDRTTLFERSKRKRCGHLSTFAVNITAALCLTLSNPDQALATEALIIGGGSNIHDSSVRFEDTVGWLQSVLIDQQVNVTTFFNDGDSEEHDTYYEEDVPPTATGRVFGQYAMQKRRYRGHQLNGVQASSRISDIEPAITSQLAASNEQDLLLIGVGHGRVTDASNDSTSMLLWDNTELTSNQLHEWIAKHERAVRFVFAQNHSGSFHRLAYAHNASNSLQLGNTLRCGFTSTTSYGVAELDTAASEESKYRDYTSYFFSAISGYEHDGEIISRFSDLNNDGHTSLREAHLYTLEEARSIELSLSTSEDYLLRWQPWYLRWQPASKQLPNNEYSRVFRDLANALNVNLSGNVAKDIREGLKIANGELQVLQQQRAQHQSRILQLQSSLRTTTLRLWPALAAPYSQGFETLVREGQLPAVQTHLASQQPAYNELVTLQAQISQQNAALRIKHRTITQHKKLLHLRHLALLQRQLYDHGTSQNIEDYRSLVKCEEAPLLASAVEHTSANQTVISEDTTQ